MSELLCYDSQEAEYFIDKNIIKLKINEPFHSAGSQYKWKEIYGKEGIGINEKLITFAVERDSTLLIQINNDFYSIDSWIIQDFCEKTNSIFIKKVQNKEVILYVFPTINLNKLPYVKQEEIQVKL